LIVPSVAGIVANGSLRVAYLGEAMLLGGRVGLEIDVAARAPEHAEAHGERGNRAWELRVLGEIASRRDPPNALQAEAAYRQALSLAEQLGMRPFQAHCHLGLGSLYRRVGHLDAARAELAAAADLYRSMGMQFWLPEVEARLGIA